MKQSVRLTVNGAVVVAAVEPRLHLADFVREHLLLTGTHLGCEHGVCGACTLLIDGLPARSCIAFAAACDGAEVRTIEGLEHDPVIVRLRAAFTAEHGLQCGYCTPGMLVTARDIVLRLPRADETRIRLELAGNLCRCTGYAGIVRAIARVLGERMTVPSPPALAGGEGQGEVGAAERGIPGSGHFGPSSAAPPPYLTPALSPPEGAERGKPLDYLTQRLRIAAPLAEVWRAVQDPALIASCVPGATLTERQAENIAGELAVALGPMQARFVGRATIGFGPGLTARVGGEGRDTLSGTRLTAQAEAVLREDGPATTVLDFSVRYTLRGPLAQFARGAVLAAFAAEFSEVIAANLAARLAGTAPPAPSRLGLLRLLWAVLRRWLSRR